MGMTGSTTAVQEELRSAGIVLAGAGLSPGTTGNMSVRVDDRLFVTASGAWLADVGELAEVDLTGNLFGGPRPTKEVPMHVGVYVADPRWRAAIHLHSTFATLMSTLADLDEHDAIPAITPYLTMRAGHVGVVPYAPPGSPEIGKYVTDLVRVGYSALLMRNHGSLVIGATIADALALAFELEESAKLAVFGRGLSLVTLTAAQRAALRS